MKVAWLLVALTCAGCGNGAPPLKRSAVDTQAAAVCPPCEVLRILAYYTPSDDELPPDWPEGANVPTETEVRACLTTQARPERAWAARYLLRNSLPLPTDLLRQFEESEVVEERELSYECEGRSGAALDRFWSRLTQEENDEVVEIALYDLVTLGNYDGDPRALDLLLRVLGPRFERPMLSIVLLKRLLPEAQVDITPVPDTAATIANWHEWVVGHREELRYDRVKGAWFLRK